MTEPIVSPLGYSHVRLTVTDIGRSKAFYSRLFGMLPGVLSLQDPDGINLELAAARP